MTKKASKASAARPQVPAAIAALKAAISDSGSEPSSGGGAIASAMRDPAIAGATRKEKSKVVTLGADPGIMPVAAEAATISSQISRLSGLFFTSQTRLRDYGKEKRRAYNDLFRTDVTTFQIPYSVDVVRGEPGSDPVRETRHVQVICSNKYSVSAEPIIKGDEVLGDWKDKLFNFESTKVLRPNAEELIRGILEGHDIKGEALERAMDLLLEEHVKVSTVDDYERLEREAPEPVRTFLSQTVTRHAPSIKFLDEEN